MATTINYHESGKFYYGTSANPSSTDASEQVYNVRESSSQDTTRVPRTLGGGGGFSRKLDDITQVSFSFLSDGSLTGSGGFLEFLTTNSATNTTIYIVWQPTSEATFKREYKCTAARPTVGSSVGEVLVCDCTLDVESVTDTYPT